VDDITSMAHDRLLLNFTANIERDVLVEELGMTPRTVAMRDEILRRMDAATVRLDVLPDGHDA
jgi:hypothetical protein